MKRLMLVVSILALGALTWAAFERTESAPAQSFARYIPNGALLMVESPDFGKTLQQWNASTEKQEWLKSANYKVFMNSRLLLRLQDAQSEFTAAAGLSPDLPFLQQVAGGRTALAIYDIGKLELLYISHVSNSRAIETALWQKRSRFEPRDAAGKQFFVRTDSRSGRVAAFAIDGDMLVLGTREDLVAGALSLLAGKKMTAIADEAWYDNAVKAAQSAGELRMVLHLAEIARTPQFRTYWIQRNITELSQYESAISDLRLASDTYREQRILLPKAAQDCNAMAASATSVAELTRFVPDKVGFYRASTTTVEDALAALETKILTPRLGPVSTAAKLAPVVTTTNVAESGLDVQIDVAPNVVTTDARSDAALKALLSAARPRALLELHRSATASDGVFVQLYSTLVLSSDSNWDEAAVQSAIRQVVAPPLSTSTLGVEWKSVGSGPVRHFELDGSATLAIAVRGKQLFVSNDPETLASALSRTGAPASPALYIAHLDHARERANYARLMTLIDKPSSGSVPNGQPEFFSQNVASLSDIFARVQSESVSTTCSAGNITQTVVYEWAK